MHMRHQSGINKYVYVNIAMFRQSDPSWLESHTMVVLLAKYEVLSKNKAWSTSARNIWLIQGMNSPADLTSPRFEGE